MLEQFRKLGVVVEVEDGVLVNRKAINMCTAGEPITPEGAKLLVSGGVTENSIGKMGVRSAWCFLSSS